MSTTKKISAPENIFKRRRGRPRKNNNIEKNISSLKKKNINIGEISYFTDVINDLDNVFTIEFTNVNGNPAELIRHFNKKFRDLCNTIRHERPFVPYAGYRIIEHTEKDPIIFGSCNKTKIMLTCIGTLFLARVLEKMCIPRRRSYVVELFYKKTATQAKIYNTATILCELGTVDNRIFRTRENLPKYAAAETKYLDYFVNVVLRTFSERVQSIQTHIETTTEDGELFPLQVEIHQGNVSQSIGVDYLDSALKFRKRQAFGYFYNRGRRRSREDQELDRLYEERRLRRSADIEGFCHIEEEEV